VRTFLTYVLAALAAATMNMLMRGFRGGPFANIIDGVNGGDPALIAGGISELVVLFVMVFVIASTLGSLIWIGVVDCLGSIGVQVGRFGSFALGVIMFGALALPMSHVLVWDAVTEIGVGFQTATWQSVFGPMFVKIFPEWTVAGAAWGIVHWTRSRKPQTAGAAA
jgi:hypothetical protein